VRDLTHDQFTETVSHVLQYAALELLSLAVLCVLLDRLLGFSTLRLLAFTLRKHAVLAHAQLTIWVLMPTQLTLEHFGAWVTSVLAVCLPPLTLNAWRLGCDYTFRFAWLRHAVEQNTTTRDGASAT
jgi:hypothetical protein